MGITYACNRASTRAPPPLASPQPLKLRRATPDTRNSAAPIPSRPARPVNRCDHPPRKKLKMSIVTSQPTRRILLGRTGHHIRMAPMPFRAALFGWISSIGHGTQRLLQPLSPKDQIAAVTRSTPRQIPACRRTGSVLSGSRCRRGRAPCTELGGLGRDAAFDLFDMAACGAEAPGGVHNVWHPKAQRHGNHHEPELFAGASSMLGHGQG